MIRSVWRKGGRGVEEDQEVISIGGIGRPGSKQEPLSVQTDGPVRLDLLGQLGRPYYDEGEEPKDRDWPVDQQWAGGRMTDGARQDPHGQSRREDLFNRQPEDDGDSRVPDRD